MCIRDSRNVGAETFTAATICPAASRTGAAAGQIVAAVNVSAPTFRFDDRLEAAAESVVEAANELAALATR